MNTKTWQERVFKNINALPKREMQAEIDELRAALRERDETIKDLHALLRTQQHFLLEAHDELNGKETK